MFAQMDVMLRHEMMRCKCGAYPAGGQGSSESGDTLPFRPRSRTLVHVHVHVHVHVLVLGLLISRCAVPQNNH